MYSISDYTYHIAILRIKNKRLTSSDGSNYVQNSMFDCSKPKIGCSSLITKRWTNSSPFDVRKNDVQVSSMSNLVNLVKALLLGLNFDV